MGRAQGREERRRTGDGRAGSTGRGLAPADKHDERRSELAESALRTLGELGYARTSLREIAKNSEFSHGVVHYYFADKLELIVYCVRYYKARCVTRYDDVIADATSAGELSASSRGKLAETIRDEGPMHSLWYDLRCQSMFERVVPGRHAHRPAPRGDDLASAQPLRRSRRDHGPARAAAAYAMLDGLFQQALLHQLAGDENAAGDLTANVVRVLDTLDVRG